MKNYSQKEIEYIKAEAFDKGWRSGLFVGIGISLFIALFIYALTIIH